MSRLQKLKNERGVALAMVLMVLVVLTLLGLAAMKTSILEVRMSGNVQDSTSSFQAAESGLLAGAANAKLDIYNTSTQTFCPSTTNGWTTTCSGTSAVSAVVQTQYDSMSIPPRGWGYSIIHYQVANFDQQSTGTTLSGAKTTINQGMYQVVNK